MLRITYISSESYKLSSDDLLAILGKCNKNNQRLGLTGMLIYGNGTFIQSVEGDEKIVKNTISKISSDTRHKDFKVLSEEIAEKRLYDEFNMGFERLTEDSISNITSLKSLSLKQLNSQFLSKNTQVVEDLLQRHRSTHWNLKWTPDLRQQFKWDTVTRNGVNHDRDKKAQRTPAGAQSQGRA